jgi:hypothetical protein
MQEVFPVMLGVLFGLAATRLPKSGQKLAIGAPACVLTGVAVSAMNGELTQSGWFVFASVDAMLVWLGAVTVLVGVRGIRGHRTTAR